MKKFFIYTGFLLLAFTGCFALPAEAPMLPPPTIARPIERTFETVPVRRGDVLFESNPFADYLSARVERLRFDVDGLPLLGIFVAAGDEVSEGAIIAALDLPEIQDELDELNGRRARLVLDIELLRERHELALYLAEISGEPIDDMSFLVSLNRLNTDLVFLDRRIAYISRLNEGRYLRANFDGVVTIARTFIDGMYSSSVLDIATITDPFLSSFVVRDPIAETMEPGDRFEMTLEYEVYLMEVIDPADFGFEREAARLGRFQVSEAFLAFVDAPPPLTLGMHGRVHMPFGAAEDVLYLPLPAVQRYPGRIFVYVLADGVRTLRDVEIGLQGGGYVEIISGLLEGELVIR